MQDNAITQPLPGSEGTESAPDIPSTTSLDSLSEFEFQGEKYTPERLQEVLNGYKTYGEKIREYEAYDKFDKNLDTDLESVMQDPSLVSKFKSIYPKKYHSMVDRLVGSKTQPEGQANSIPKEILNKINRVDFMEQRLHEMAVESANAKLDATLPKLWEKYPMAVEDAVLARAEGFIANGGKLTDQVWERLAKESHEAVSKKADAHYKKELQSQLNKGSKAADIGSGGAVPGKAPPKFRSFDDAREAMIKYAKENGITV